MTELNLFMILCACIFVSLHHILHTAARVILLTGNSDYGLLLINIFEELSISFSVKVNILIPEDKAIMVRPQATSKSYLLLSSPSHSDMVTPDSLLPLEHTYYATS